MLRPGCLKAHRWAFVWMDSLERPRTAGERQRESGVERGRQRGRERERDFPLGPPPDVQTSLFSADQVEKSEPVGFCNILLQRQAGREWCACVHAPFGELWVVIHS